MQIRNVSDKRTFCYCKAKALKEFQYKKTKVSIGELVFVMLYPNNDWYIFNTMDESKDKQFVLSDNAKIRIDFEPIDI